jgi:hypothetical protein
MSEPALLQHFVARHAELGCDESHMVDDLTAIGLVVLRNYREATRIVRTARTRLERFDFLAAVAETFGPEAAAAVGEGTPRI